MMRPVRQPIFAFPRISPCNEAREYLEGMIGRFCRYYSLPLPRRYKRQARKVYLAFAKCRKHTAKKARAARIIESVGIIGVYAQRFFRLSPLKGGMVI